MASPDVIPSSEEDDYIDLSNVDDSLLDDEPCMHQDIGYKSWGKRSGDVIEQFEHKLPKLAVTSLETNPNQLRCSGDNHSKDRTSLPNTADLNTVSLKLRGYQKEISENILRGENDIIILPTGAGKTLVASNLIHHHLQKRCDLDTGSSKVLFLAPTRVLVEQQLEAIKTHLGETWGSQCRSLTSGDVDGVEILAEILTGGIHKVIIATPQLVVNYFDAFESSTMKKFSLIIMDECHNSKGNEPYSFLLDRYMEETMTGEDNTDLPQLVGLTATIGIGKPKSTSDAQRYMMSFCSRMFLLRQPKQVILHKQELEDSVDKPFSAYRYVQSRRKDAFSTKVKEIMKKILDYVKEKLNNVTALKHIGSRFKPAADFLEPSLIQKIGDAVKGLGICHELVNEVPRQCIGCLQHVEVYHRALKWANLARLGDANQYIREEMKRAELQCCEFYEDYKNEWAGVLENLSLLESESPNDKLQVLKEEMDKILMKDDMRIDDGFASKVIVFVDDRKLTTMIRDWLNSLGKKYRAERFVSSQVTSDKDGMHKNDADDVMQQFRSGELNILVSTSILAEGVDVAECNGVIRYMCIGDAIAEVQVVGRVRVKDGHCVGLFDDKLKKQYEENKIKEKWMSEELEKLRKIPEDEFLEKMKLLQKSHYTEKKHKDEVASKGSEKSRDLLAGAEVNCVKCGRYLGLHSSIYCYMKSHYIVMDRRLLERVTVKSCLPAEYEYLFDGFTATGSLICRGPENSSNRCSATLGKIQTLNVNNEKHRIASWDLPKISFTTAERKPLTFKKWKEAEVQAVTHEKVKGLIIAGEFIQE